MSATLPDITITVPGARRAALANAIAQSVLAQQEQLDERIASGGWEEISLAQAANLQFLRETATTLREG